MKFALIAVLIMALPSSALAEVRINEIAWMGTVVSSSDEWIELYNDGVDVVSLSGWTLEWDVETSSPKSIELSGDIDPEGYYLLERTDDNSVPTISADAIYVGSLGNDGEEMVLRRGNEVIDRIDAANGWLAGDSAARETMQRMDDGWITASATPRAKNASTADIVTSSSTQSQEVMTSETTHTYSAYDSLIKERRKGHLSIRGLHDRESTVGAPVLFLISVFDDKGVSVSASYSWTFGDGYYANGSHITHVYGTAGKYVVTLRVSVQGETFSVRAEVLVNPLDISVSRTGNGTRITNKSDKEVNLGGFKLAVAGREIVLPADSIVLAKESVLFSDELLRLIETDSLIYATLFFPDGSIAADTRASKPSNSTKAQIIPKSEPKVPVVTKSVLDRKISSTAGITATKETANIEEKSSATVRRVVIHSKKPGILRNIVAFPRTSFLYIKDLLF